ncbi:MAG: hypothetical protein RLZZ303_3356 [Candidatus Hydrogenedentota bacterium]
MNVTIHLNRWLAALALLALPALGAWAQTTVTPANGADLTDLINNAQANTRIRLDGNSSYTINGVVLIQENRNSPILIEGPGGNNDDRPDKVRIQLGGTANITVEQNATLTLDSVGLYGGAPGVQVAVGATLNLANAFLSQGSPSVLIPFGGGTVNAASSVFASCNRGIIQSGGVTNIVQCTFVETAPASILLSGGKSTVVSSLFAGPGDAPIVLGGSAVGYWHGNLIEQNTAAPVGYNSAVTAAPPRTDPIVFSTDVDAWPGKLDEAQTPALASGVTATATEPSITEALDAVAGLVKSDFEGDRRANTSQVGADELGAGQLAGWISGLILVTDGNGQPVVNTNGLTVAGKSEQVFIQVETRGINLSTAELVIEPELGDKVSSGLFEPIPITELSSGFGQARFTAPSQPCYTTVFPNDSVIESIWDGRATLYIRSGSTDLEGDDNNLAAFEYQFIIDTTPPVLGFDANGIAYDQLRLADVVTSNDRAGAYGGPFPTAWGPQVFGGFNPSNESRFGVNDGSQTLGLNRSYPQHVYFNGPLDELVPFTFTLPLQFFDAPPLDCDTGQPVSVETAGFLPGTAPITVIADAYGVVNGDAFLNGSPPAQLAAGSFAQTSTPGTRLSTFDTLDVEWAFGNLIHDTSWRVVLNPSAADIAGNLFNSITGPGFHRDMEFWCLEETDLTAQNVSLQGPGNPESPSFSWSINRSPSPNRTMVDTCQQLVAFRLWRFDATDPTRAVSATEWSRFDSLQEINAASDVDGDLLGDRLLDPLNIDQTMMLTILVADEAGNLSANLPPLDTVAFPQSNAALTPGLGVVITNFTDFADEGLIPFVYWTNTADLGSDVDTRIRAKLFWNRVDGDAALPLNVRQVNTTVGERDFASSTRIPLPARDTCGGVLSRVEGQFYLTATGQNAAEECRVIRWELLEDSRVVAVGGMRVYRETGYTGILQVPEDIIVGALNEAQTAALYDLPFQMVVTGTSPSNIPDRRIFRSSECPDAAPGDRLGDEGGDSKRRRDVKYMLRASTLNLVGREPCNDPLPLMLTLNDVSEDSSPATFQFTVTPGDEDGSGGGGVSAGEQPVKIQTQR